jgi:glycosyltransferase involved in cell wall biosynthesis
MRIAIAGPISVQGLRKYLNNPDDDLPVGNDGAPLLNTLITALVDRGHEISAYTLDFGLEKSNVTQYTTRGKNGFRLFVGPYRKHAFRSNHIGCGRMLDMFRLERRFLIDTIRMDKPDLVHAHWTYEYALAAIDSGYPHAITAHDAPFQVLRYNPGAYRAGRYLMARRTYQKAHILTAVSPYLKKQVQRYTNIPIRIIGNPIPHKVLDALDHPVARRQVSQCPKVAMILNGWGRLKNGKSGLRAFSFMRKKFPGATLYCFGVDFGVGEAASKWAIKKRLDIGVEFIGATPHDELLDRIKSIDLLLHPALEESFGLVLIEAMALGIPVIAGRESGAVPWVIDDGKAGVLTDVRSPYQVSNAIFSLLNDSDAYERIVNTARGRIRKHFSPESVAEQYEAVYSEALLGHLPLDCEG